MKKLLALLSIAVIVGVFVCCFAGSAVVASADSSYSDPYYGYQRICENYKDRTAGTAAEKSAAQWLAGELLAIKVQGMSVYSGCSSDSGINAYLQGFSYPYTVTDLLGDTNDVTVNSQNVLAYKRCGIADAKLLVISSGYSNTFMQTDANGNPCKNEGAYASSGGVGVLLSVAEAIKDAQLSFDVAFLFYGAGYYNYMGVSHFFDNNTQELLGNIDLCAVTGGEQLYVYYDEVSTTHGSFLDDRIKRFDYNIKGAPFDKKYFTTTDSYLPYSHAGLYGSADICLRNKVALVELFGFSWDSYGNRESAVYDNVLGTSSDTFSYMDINYGEDKIRERLTTVRDFIVGAVISDGDLADAMGSYTNTYDPIISEAARKGFFYSVLCLLVALFVLGVVLTAKRTRSAGTPDFSTNSRFLNSEDDSITTDDDIFCMTKEQPLDDNSSNTVSGEAADGDNQHKTADDKPDDSDDIFGEF